MIALYLGGLSSLQQLGNGSTTASKLGSKKNGTDTLPDKRGSIRVPMSKGAFSLKGLPVVLHSVDNTVERSLVEPIRPQLHED